MHSPLPLTRELVLVGGGHTHALVLRMWGMNPLPGVRVTVINPDPTAAYSGMLPGFVAGHYSRDELNIDLVRLARFAGARLIADRATGLNVTRRRVRLESGREIPWNVASIDIGITSDLPDIPGFAEHGVAAKPLSTFADRWQAFRQAVAEGSAAAEVVVLGGGVAGVELALAMHEALARHAEHPRITIVDRAALLPGIGAAARNVLLSELYRRGIETRPSTEVARVEPAAVSLTDGTTLPSAFTLGAGGARPHGWLAGSRLALSDGYVAVDETLRSVNTEGVFAAGDCAHLSHAPRPKAGVFAVREAPVLFHNLRVALSHGRLRKFRPQSDYLKLISTGGKTAAADKWGMRASGALLWKWKDRIDRRFMRRFSELRPMRQDALPKARAAGLDDMLGDKPLCGGCGSKVGSGALEGALADMPLVRRDDVLSGPGDDAAVLRGYDGRRQVITSDHLRSFTQDPWLMARITAIHALGDIWAMGAEPQSALVNLILPRMSPELQGQWVGELTGAVNDVLAPLGAAIVGGHTSMGAELTVGLTVTGLCESDPITLAGARPGDVLVLTKPIGTGTILAAEMAMQARGNWVMATYESMQKPQAEAAAILAGAHAMTDVTGFGLAGHALEMARASGLSITLRLEDIPLLPGAEALAEAGVKSSIWSDNRRLLAQVPLPASPRAALLFDPQTAGGLLAAVPEPAADGLLAQLQATGYAAAAVGTCEEGPATLKISA